MKTTLTTRLVAAFVLAMGTSAHSQSTDKTRQPQQRGDRVQVRIPHLDTCLDTFGKDVLNNSGATKAAGFPRSFFV